MNSIGTDAFANSGLTSLYMSENTRVAIGAEFGSGKTVGGKSDVLIINTASTIFRLDDGTDSVIDITGELVKTSYTNQGISEANIIEVYVGSNVTSLGGNAFYDIDNLIRCYIPSSVTKTW